MAQSTLAAPSLSKKRGRDESHRYDIELAKHVARSKKPNTRTTTNAPDPREEDTSKTATQESPVVVVAGTLPEPSDVAWEWVCQKGKWLADLFATVYAFTSDARLEVRHDKITLIPQIGRCRVEVGFVLPAHALDALGTHKFALDAPLLVALNVEDLYTRCLRHVKKQERTITLRVRRDSLASSTPVVQVVSEATAAYLPHQDTEVPFLCREYAHFGIPKTPAAYARIDDADEDDVPRFTTLAMDWKRLLSSIKSHAPSVRFGLEGSYATMTPLSSAGEPAAAYKYALDLQCQACKEGQLNQLAHMEAGGCCADEKEEPIGSPIGTEPLDVDAARVNARREIVDMEALLLASKKVTNVAKQVGVYFGALDYGVLLEHELTYGGFITHLVPAYDTVRVN